MSNRLDLHKLLVSIVGPNVYYQPPTTMKYPCVKYERDKIENKYANNLVYNQNDRYSITYMSRTIDDKIIETLSKLPKCSYDRSFINDNIYHTVFNIYY